MSEQRTVFVVSIGNGDYYECDEVLGVFDSLDLAKQAAQNALMLHPTWARRGPATPYDVEIVAFQLNMFGVQGESVT